MGYIGLSPTAAQQNYLTIDDISSSFDGSTTSFALQVGGVAPSPFPVTNSCLISVGGVIQNPDDSGTEGFRISGTNIVFSSAPGSGQDFFGVVLAGADYLNVGANFPVGTVGNPSITFDGDLNTGFYRPSADELGLVSGGVEAARIDSNRRLGVGVTAPTTVVHAEAAQAELQLKSTTGTNSAGVRFVPGGETNAWYIYADGSRNLIFDDHTSSRARIDSSGRLLVGTTSSTGVTPPGESFTTAARLQVSGSSASGQATLQATDTGTSDVSLGGSVSLTKHRSDDAAVPNGWTLGSVYFNGYDSAALRVGAMIQAEADGDAWASGDCPTRLLFHTTADSASSPTERAVIDNAGRLNISTSAQASSFTRDASLRIMSGTITRNADFAMMNTGYSGVMVHLSCERGGSGSYNFMDLYSGRRYDNSSGDRETSLQGDGNNYCDGSWNGGGADYAEMFEWSDANPDAEDRRGLSVVLDGDKIREAVAGEDPIGVISGNPSVVGDAAWNKWHEKYLTDDFGTYQKETYSLTEWQDENGETQSYESDRIPADVTVPDDAVIKTVDDAGATLTRRVLNPSYDPDVVYVPRKERPEWDCVGLMGKLRIRKGQATGARWIKMRDISDTVEEWLVR